MAKKPVRPVTVRWKSPLEANAEKFFDTVKATKSEKDFGQPYIDAINEKRKKQYSIVLKLAIFQLALLLYVSALFSPESFKFSFLVLPSELSNQDKNMLVILYAFISIISATIWYAISANGALIKEWNNRQFDDTELRKHSLTRYSFEQYFPSPKSSLLGKHEFWHPFTKTLEILSVVVVIVGFLYFIFLYGFAYIRLMFLVIDDIDKNSVSSIFAATSLGLSIVYTTCFSLVQNAMPYKDYNYLYEADKLEKSNPDKYREWLSDNAAYDEKQRHKVQIVIFEIVVFSISTAWIYKFDTTIFTTVGYFSYAFTMIVTGVLIVNPLTDAIRGFIYRLYTQLKTRHEEGWDANYTTFKKYKIAYRIVFMAVCAAYGIATAHILVTL